MKRNRTYEELLSAYLDGELQDEEKRFVETELLNEPQWKKRYEEMRVIRAKMLSLPKDQYDSSLWPSLSGKLQTESSSEKSAIIPGRLAPIITVLLVVVVGLGSFYVTRNWDKVSGYFDETRVVVEDIYDQGIIRGALQPLFAGITNDDLIRFAMSGLLAIPEAEGQGLKVDSDMDEYYDLQFADAGDAKNAPSLNELYAMLDVTSDQMQAIDSVLTNYKNIIRSSAFIAENDEVVISPELAGLDKFIIASVAEQLVPAQRIQLNDVLNRFNPEIQIPVLGHFPQFALQADRYGSPFRVEVTPMPDGQTQVRAEVTAPEQLESDTKTMAQKRTFIVVRPDTVITRDIDIPDFSQFEKQFVDTEAIQRKVDETLAKTLHNTRIQFSSDGDSPAVQVFANVGHPDVPIDVRGHRMKLDTMVMPQFQKEHFVNLRELSKIMQKQSEIIRQRMPEFTLDDTVGIPPQFNVFDESFQKNMQQLEFDLEQLMKELEKVLEDPEKLILSPDSVYFNLFPDTLNQ